MQPLNEIIPLKNAESVDDSGSFISAWPWALSLAPVALAVFVMFYLGFDALYMDQWELVPLVGKVFDGHLPLTDLWAQHNIHRIPIPKLIMVVLARMSHWDTRWERAISLIFALSTFWLLLKLFVNVTRERKVKPWAWLIVSILFFSIAQWENLLWGWHLLIYLNLLGAVLVCDHLTLTKATPPNVCIAIVGALIATFSYGNGLVLLPVGFALIVLSTVTQRQASTPRMLAWFFASIAIVAIYAWDFAKPAYDPSYQEAFQSPTHYAHYVIAYLGAPMASFDTQLATIAGTCAILLYIALIFLAWRHPRERRETMLPFDGLAMYAIGTAFLTGTARTGFGVVQALSPRYIAYSSLLWIAIVAHLLAYLGNANPSRNSRRLITVALVLVGFGASVNSGIGLYRADERHNGHIAARDALIKGGPPELLRRLYPDDEAVLKYREVLMKYRLNVFR